MRLERERGREDGPEEVARCVHLGGDEPLLRAQLERLLAVLGPAAALERLLELLVRLLDDVGRHAVPTGLERVELERGGVGRARRREDLGERVEVRQAAGKRRALDGVGVRRDERAARLEREDGLRASTSASACLRHGERPLRVRENSRCRPPAQGEKGRGRRQLGSRNFWTARWDAPRCTGLPGRCTCSAGPSRPSSRGRRGSRGTSRSSRARSTCRRPARRGRGGLRQRWHEKEG